MKKILPFILITISLVYSFHGNAQSHIEIQKLLSPETESSELFGYVTDIDGDRAIVSAQYQDITDASSGTIIEDQGRVYIYEKDINGMWQIAQGLDALYPADMLYFGWSVAIEGDYAVVSALGDKVDSLNTNPLVFAGSATVFKRLPSGLWILVQHLVPSDRMAADWFGVSVAIHNGIIAVGASKLVDQAGSQNPLAKGAVYIFEEDVNGNWIENQKLIATDGAQFDSFGSSIAMDQNTLIVGALAQSFDSAGAPASFISGAGAIYVFEKDNTNQWNEIQKIVAPTRYEFDAFGIALDIKGDRLVGSVVSQGTHSNHFGEAHVFERAANGIWSISHTLAAPNAAAGDFFGFAVSISADFILVASPINNQNPVGINAGSIFVYENSGNGNFIERIDASDAQANHGFGFSVSSDENNVIIGAPGDSEVYNGVEVLQTGSAYILEVNACFNPIASGCTDNMACNYNPIASCDDGSCTFEDLANCLYCVNNAIILQDADGDGVCDADEIPGCTDQTASNYNPLATDNDGSCQFGTAPPCGNSQLVVGCNSTVDPVTGWIKAQWLAQNPAGCISDYIFRFTNTNNPADVQIYATGAAFTRLYLNGRNLTPGQTYDVDIATTQNGNITTYGASCSVTIGARQTELLASYAAPNVMQISDNIKTQYVGQALDYTWKITRTDVSSLPFYYTAGSNFTIVNLSNIPVVAGATYAVEIRPQYTVGGPSGVVNAAPLFGTDPTGFGPSRVLQVGNIVPLATQNPPQDATAYIQEFAVENNISIYPNPVNSYAKQITVSGFVSKAGTIKIQLFDIRGSAIKSETIYAQKGRLHQVFELGYGVAPGVYIVRIATDDETVEERLIVGR